MDLLQITTTSTCDDLDTVSSEHASAELSIYKFRDVRQGAASLESVRSLYSQYGDRMYKSTAQDYKKAINKLFRDKKDLVARPVTKLGFVLQLNNARLFRAACDALHSDILRVSKIVQNEPSRRLLSSPDAPQRRLLHRPSLTDTPILYTIAGVGYKMTLKPTSQTPNQDAVTSVATSESAYSRWSTGDQEGPPYNSKNAGPMLAINSSLPFLGVRGWGRDGQLFQKRRINSIEEEEQVRSQEQEATEVMTSESSYSQSSAGCHEARPECGNGQPMVTVNDAPPSPGVSRGTSREPSRKRTINSVEEGKYQTREREATKVATPHRAHL